MTHVVSIENREQKIEIAISSFVVSMSDMIEGKSIFASSISELESLGLVVPNLNELKYSHEVEKIAEIIKQMLFREYKSMPVFTD